jgi:light-regulated signal transduction histidine kinase (bacteriophytochrome)
MQTAQSAQPSEVTTADAPPPPDLAQEFRDYAYIVSHDLGAPARLMVEFARLLGERQSAFTDSEDRALLTEIINNGERMKAMMQGLLSFSRLNTLSAPHVPVDTGKIAEHCRLLMQEKLNQAGGRLEIGALPRLMADADQILQLFNFLIGNAVKFRREAVAPVVSVSAERSGPDWVFTVRDNGTGIEPEYREKVFKPFQKLHGDGVYPGAGMGLSLARKIVALHDGRIWIAETPKDSGMGPGAVVKFTLPAS